MRRRIQTKRDDLAGLYAALFQRDAETVHERGEPVCRILFRPADVRMIGGVFGVAVTDEIAVGVDQRDLAAACTEVNTK